jgi:hypothetical protein
MLPDLSRLLPRFTASVLKKVPRMGSTRHELGGSEGAALRCNAHCGVEAEWLARCRQLENSTPLNAGTAGISRCRDRASTQLRSVHRVHCAHGKKQDACDLCAAKHPTLKKAKSKVRRVGVSAAAAKKKRPQETAEAKQVAQMPVETTLINVIEEPAPGVIAVPEYEAAQTATSISSDGEPERGAGPAATPT